MKSRNKLLIGLIVLCAAGAAFFVYWPKPVHLDAQGVKYRLGEKDSGGEQLVRVRIDGEVRRDWKGKPTFSGTIDAEGEALPVPEDRRTVKVDLSGKPADGLIIYDYFDDDGLHMYTYGKLFADASFDSVSLNLFEQDEDGGRGWDSGSGLMITAPAKNREQALEIANGLMEREMEGEVLK
ncbi:hypothetical protein [Saccharibacillus alkalitolerans]|uniref:Uncharacterized protein n=1 Tax=Saccharibacillus alkalitolerans TaxID=2705290 RepID=A0ABX0F350_9BACL|nr:hypothetical protein [Saccharibacillus alkalitolerans]NGZ74439.1 hypothetical protein [Saccharibacillus alkalitolerans]